MPDDHAHGFTAPGFEPVAEQFELNLRERGDGGAAFAAVLDGSPVVDLWGGFADRERGETWRRDSLAGIFSGSKALVATCMLMLLERGELELDRPVHEYWPPFAARGKERILVRHVVSHLAGLPGLATPVTLEEATDAARMARLLADQPPICAPGTRLYYHALTFGWLCGELIRRVDGRSVGRFLQDEVAGPLGLDAWIGLPAEEEPRVVTLERGPGFGARGEEAEGPRGSGTLAWSIWQNPPRLSADPLPANTRAWRAAEVPASNGVASARAMARLFGCLARGGELEGARLLAPRAVALGATRIASGVEPFLEVSMAFGIGFELQTAAAPFGPAETGFGHTGSGGSVHGAWPRLRTGFSYVTSTLSEGPAADPRAAALLEALHTAVRGCVRSA